MISKIPIKNITKLMVMCLIIDNTIVWINNNQTQVHISESYTYDILPLTQRDEFSPVFKFSFYMDGIYFNAINGSVTITKLNETEIEGTFNLKAENDNEEIIEVKNGTFKAIIQE